MKVLILIIQFSISALLCFAQNGTTANQLSSRPFVLGHTLEIYSGTLSENRVLNIYLPEGYRKNDTVKYPVIYLLDGSADEDFIHVAGLLQFCNFPWVQQVPKSILVGIANVDRKRDFTFPSNIEDDRKLCPTSGGSAAFINFIEKELQPFIQQMYASSATKTLIGQSLGGLLASEILLKKPYLFDQYIILSPSLWWNNATLLNTSNQEIARLIKTETKVYIGVGKEGLAPVKIPHVMEVDANVLADKLKASERKLLQVHFDYLPLENHATIGHQSILNAFHYLYPQVKDD